MGKIGAFGMTAWMSGMAIGVGASLHEFGAVAMGTMFMVAAIVLCRRHIMPSDC